MNGFVPLNDDINERRDGNQTSQACFGCDNDGESVVSVAVRHIAVVELSVVLCGRMSGGSRRRVLVTAMVVCGLAVGGCLTLDPTVSADTNDSAVFKSLSVNESWASQRTRAKATLASTPEAGNVTQITVIKANGETFSTVNTDPGQTSVILELPANRNATLVASDTINGTTIEKLNVTTGGNTIP